MVHFQNFPVFTVWVERPPKPIPGMISANRRRFYLAKPAVLFRYIFVTSHVLATLLMHLRWQATVDIHHAALSFLPRPLLGSAFLASPGCHLFHLDLTDLIDWAHTLPSNRPSADNNADGDVQCRPRRSGLGSPLCSARKDVRRSHFPSSRLLHPLSTNASYGAFIGLEPRRRQ
jgi:hypothetical protein